MTNTEMWRKFSIAHAQNTKPGVSTYTRRAKNLYPYLLMKFNVSKHASTKLFFGEEMRVVTDELVSKALISFSYTEQALTALIVKMVKGDSVFMDIGTHFGYEALLVSQIVEAGKGRIFCFEPNPYSYRIAEFNLKRYPQIELVNAGISSSSGNGFLEKTSADNVAFAKLSTEGNNDSYAVQLVSLNDFCDSHKIKEIDFVKVDVEGHEMDILKGMGGVLKKQKPILVLEADMPEAGKISQRGMEFASYLADYDYYPYIFDFDGDLKIGPLNSFPVHHANILFVPSAKKDLIQEYLVTDRVDA